MSAAEAPRYSAIALEHFRRPQNVGRLPEANAVGVVDDRQSENFISIYLQIEADRIIAAKFRTFGCSAGIAASSMITTLVLDRSLTEARAVDATALLVALDGLPDGKHHCAELAARALASALEAYRPQARPTSTA